MEAKKLQPICLVCGKSENVKLFKDITLAKCKVSSLIRQKAKLQYSDVKVPEKVDTSIGYHTRPCYSNFNSIKSKYISIQSKEEDDVNDADKILLDTLEGSDIETLNEAANAPELPDRLCIFCKKCYRRVKNRYLPLSKTKNYSTFDTILNYAAQWDDIELLNKIHSCINNNSTIFYHRYCKSSYSINSNTKIKTKTKWDMGQSSREKA